MTKHEDESVTLKSRGVSPCGEILVGSNQVQAVMQSMINDYELALKNQQAELVRLRKENAELKEELKLHNAIDSETRSRIYEKGQKMQAIRDLEQQAKGAEDIIESVLGEPENLTSDALSIRYEFLDRAKQLREQAKGGDL